jgi:hypothetical protein
VTEVKNKRNKKLQVVRIPLLLALAEEQQQLEGEGEGEHWHQKILGLEEEPGKTPLGFWLLPLQLVSLPMLAFHSR